MRYTNSIVEGFGQNISVLDDAARIETHLASRIRHIANRYRSWRITEEQMQREVRQAIVDAKQEVIDLLKDNKK